MALPSLSAQSLPVRPDSNILHAKKLNTKITAAVNMDYLTRNIGAIRRCQKDIRGRDLAWLTSALHQRVAAELADLFGREGSWNHGVQIGPGATSLTRIFLSANDFANAKVNACIAPLLAV